MQQTIECMAVPPARDEVADRDLLVVGSHLQTPVFYSFAQLENTDFYYFYIVLIRLTKNITYFVVSNRLRSETAPECLYHVPPGC